MCKLQLPVLQTPRPAANPTASAQYCRRTCLLSGDLLVVACANYRVTKRTVLDLQESVIVTLNWPAELDESLVVAQNALLAPPEAGAAALVVNQ